MTKNKCGLEKKFVEDVTIHPYRELFDESGKTRELIGGIMSHGSQEVVSSVDEFSFAITPIDLYLMASDEDLLLDEEIKDAFVNERNYFRKYKAGSVLQNYVINFYTSSDPWNYKRGEKQNAYAFGGLTHFPKGAEIQELDTKMIFQDDMEDDRKMFSIHNDIYLPKEVLQTAVDDSDFNGEIIYSLSDIFKYIAVAKDEGKVVPDKWIGRFCRGADDSEEEGAFPLSIELFQGCKNSDMGELPSDFFKGKVDVSDTLVKESSLSTSNMLQNFTGIFNDVMEYITAGNTIPDIIQEHIYHNHEMNLHDFLEIMKSAIEGFHPLKYKDICVILLIYNILTS